MHNQCHQLICQENAREIIAAHDQRKGYWFGGGNIVTDETGNFWLIGRYRDHGDSRTGLESGARGLELSLFKSEDNAESFQKVRSWSKSEIENARNYDHFPSDMKYRIIDIKLKNKFYDSIQFYYIPGDKKFIVQSLNGRKGHNNINDCYNQKQEVEEELSDKFKNAKINKQRKLKHLDDPTGKSTYTITFFNFEKNKGRANVSCYDMYLTKKRDVFIAVSIQSQQVSAWIDSNYGVK